MHFEAINIKYLKMYFHDSKLFPLATHITYLSLPWG